MSSAPTSFAKNIKEAALVFLDDISFKTHREVAVFGNLSELTDEQSFVLVVGKKPISLDAVPQGKRYMFVGITNLIHEGGHYPLATSLAVADAETAKIVVDDILVCAEDGDATVMSPDIFADIVDGKMLRIVSPKEESLQNAKAIWYCPMAGKELPEVNKTFGEICELANEECDAFSTASSLNGREKDYLIVIDEI